MHFSVWGLLESNISRQSYNSVEAAKSTFLKAWDDIVVDYLQCTVDSVVELQGLCRSRRVQLRTSTAINGLVALIDCLIDLV